MLDLLAFLNPSTTGLALTTIFFFAFILGILHGITPDEHTWPITFSYSVGSYSTRGGMKSGFAFSLGFTLQRSILTTLGYLGFAVIYRTYNLDGLVYILVGFFMFIAGSYVLKGKYLHLPLDKIFGGQKHHHNEAERLPIHELENTLRPVPIKMATLHGLIAGFGFGAYATIITFILAPQVPGLIYAPLVGFFFGVGTMCMQIILGAAFANIMRVKKFTLDELKYMGRSTASRALYYGGLAFIVIGLLVVFFPFLNSFSVSTGVPIPNLDSIGITLFIVIIVVGVIGLGSMYKGYKEIKNGIKTV